VLACEPEACPTLTRGPFAYDFGDTAQLKPLVPMHTIQAAARADEEGRERTIRFNLSGHGHFDLGAYDAYLHGQLEDFALPENEIARALQAIEPLPKPAGVA